MGELWFVGLGLGEEPDLSPRIREIVRSAGAVFAEEYTSRLAPGVLGALGALRGSPLPVLDRAAVEDGREFRAALEEHPIVVLLVAGDPFVATTHVALRNQVEGWGHRWAYLPNATVLSAVPSLLGLMHYRFGRVVSVPFEAPGFAPRSPLEAIDRNRAAGLHSLVLLDLDPASDRYLTADAAIRWLAERDSRPPALFPPGTPVAVVARAGRPDWRAWFGPRSLLERMEFGAPLHAVVVPAPELHDEEARAIRRFQVTGPAEPGASP